MVESTEKHVNCRTCVCVYAMLTSPQLYCRRFGLACALIKSNVDAEMSSIRRARDLFPRNNFAKSKRPNENYE